MKIPSFIRHFNKRFLNRLTGRIARSNWGPFSIICHTGRQTGKQYETPLIVIPTQDGFVVALTYGPNVDWYRNIKAAGGGSILRRGVETRFGKVESMLPQTALTCFPAPARAILKIVGIQDFIKLKLVDTPALSQQGDGS